MVPFRARLKFSPDACESVGGKATTRHCNAAEQTYNKPRSDGNCVLPL